MTIEFHCPQCEKLLRTSDEKAGATAKCPQCGHPIEVPQPDGHDQPESDTYGLDQDQNADQYGDEYDDEYGAVAPPPVSARTKPCPMCGEEVSVSARRCEYCGEELGTPSGKIHPTQIDVGDVISTSWEIFKAEMGLCIGGVVLAIAVQFGVNIATQIVSMIAQVAAAAGPAGAIVAVLVIFVLMVIQISAQWFLQLGVTNLTIKIARGQPAEISDIFAVRSFFLRMVGNTLVLILITLPFVGIAVGFAIGGTAVDAGGLRVLLFTAAGVTYFGTLIVYLIFWPYPFVLLDQNPPGLDSLWTARRLVTNNLLASFLLGLVALGVNLGGLFACCVGLLFTVPFTAVMLAVAYCRMTGQRTAY